MIAKTPFRRVVSVACIAAAALLAWSESASAKTLDEAMKGLARDVSNYLSAKKESGIVVGSFDGPAESSAGSVMRKKLMDELSALKVESLKRGLKVEGSFIRDEKDAVVEITLTMKDRNNAAVTQFNALAFQETVDNPEDVAALNGATVPQPKAAVPAGDKPAGDAPPGDTPPAGSAPDPSIVATAGKKALAKAIANPTFDTLNPIKSIVAADKGTPYRVELLARPQGGAEYAPRPVTNEEGLAFCSVNPGEEYAVKVYNDSEYDCAVKLTIDGLNCFEFSDVPEFKGLGMWVVPKKSVLLVRGWYRTNALSEAFLVTGVPDSAVAKLGTDTGSIGTVTACFFAAWAQGEPQPPIEPVGSRGAGAATARGAAQAENFTTVVRFIGQTMLSSVSVRYTKPDDLPVE